MSRLFNPTDVVGIISQYSRWDGWIAEKTKVLSLPNVSAKLSTSRVDEANATRGLISPAEVRSVQLEQVLVDTGATTLCLPAEIVTRLGLELLREAVRLRSPQVDVTTAAGWRQARIFQDAKISLKNKTRCADISS